MCVSLCKFSEDTLLYDLTSKFQPFIHCQQQFVAVCTHTTYIWNIKWQECVGMGLNSFIFKKINKNWSIKTKKKSWYIAV